jgi:hypothetical protein
MFPSIVDCLANLSGTDSVAHEAALTLGLLLERSRPGTGPAVPGTDELLPAELRGRRLSTSELEQVTTGLIRYVSDAAEPCPMAVWALSKTSDPRVRPVLVELLGRFTGRPDKEHIAYQALVGVIASPGAVPLVVVRDVRERGSGRLRETAEQYLLLHGQRSE